MLRVQVAVMGVGPAGAVAAARLAEQGAEVLVLDTDIEQSAAPRPASLAPETLGLLDRLGWSRRLEAQGRQGVAQGAGGRLHCELPPPRHLGARLLRGDPRVELAFAQRVVGLDQDDGGVFVCCESIRGIETIRADYVIIAEDGGAVGQALAGVRFEAAAPRKVVTISTDAPIERSLRGLGDVEGLVDPAGAWAIQRTRSGWRLMLSASGEDGLQLTGEGLDRLWLGLTDGARPREARCGEIRVVRPQLAHRYLHGRVLLAAEAAHPHVPVVGWSLDLAIQDAWALAESLGAALQDGALAASELARYERERRADARRAFELAAAQGRTSRWSGAGDGCADLDAQAGDRSLSRGRALRRAIAAALPRRAVPA